MAILKFMITAALALLAGWFVESASADTAYLCEGGRIVYAKPENIERLKREDPCIARYFGLEAPAKPGAEQAHAVATPAAPQTTAGAVRIVNSGGESGRWFKPNR